MPPVNKTAATVTTAIFDFVHAINFNAPFATVRPDVVAAKPWTGVQATCDLRRARFKKAGVIEREVVPMAA
jgi:hypothetical protein